jgi:ATP-dependent exoDNAse (exonuclease V) beta subunit
LATASAQSEGIGERAAEVASLSVGALRSPTVASIFRSPSPRREVYVATAVDDVVVDGYIDLCALLADGLVIVDFKTDAVADEGAVAGAAEHYRWQAAAYALALADATGKPVNRCVLVFLATPGGAVEFEVGGLPGLVQQVRAAVGCE